MDSGKSMCKFHVSLVMVPVIIHVVTGAQPRPRTLTNESSGNGNGSNLTSPSCTEIEIERLHASRVSWCWLVMPWPDRPAEQQGAWNLPKVPAS
ncbi:hypothetical protein QR685DRAFT_522913, partial [Neurospora intermedia]